MRVGGGEGGGGVGGGVGIIFNVFDVLQYGGAFITIPILVWPLPPVFVIINPQVNSYFF